MSSGYYGFTPGSSQFSAGSYSARPAAAAYVTYPAVQTYSYAPVVSAPGAATGYATAFQNAGATAFQPAAVPRHDFQQPSTGYFARPAQTYYAQPTISAPPAIAAKPIPGSATTVPNTTYNGYEAVVYSYLQSKATGTSSQWLGLKRGNSSNNTTLSTGVTTLTPGGSGGGPHVGGSGGHHGGGGRGSFQRKGTGGGGQSRSQQLHYCDVCKISCAGPQTYREHLEGQKHKKKEAQVKSGQQPAVAKTKTTYRCDLCGVTCTGQDTYQAHARGAKHQKTLKLHQTLGKPIPSTEPTVIPPANKSQKSNGGGQRMSSDLVDYSFCGDDGQEADAILGYEKDVEPVGGDYIEPQKSDDGKVISYYCKLCDCRFNDVNAKEMHLKGRRHRLQFKKKVNPDLEVDMKPSPKSRRQNEERMRKEARFRQQDMWSMRQMYQPRPLMGPMGMNTGPVPLFGCSTAMKPNIRGETLDDRYLMAKHSSIYPTDDEMNAVQRIVVNTEKALKGVSDYFTDEGKGKKIELGASIAPTIKTESASNVDEELNSTATVVVTSETPASNDERLLKGVMRVGDLAKQLMLRGDLRVDLVVLCSEKPTLTLLKKVAELLPDQFSSFTEDKFDVVLMDSDSALWVISMEEPRIHITVTFSSVLMRDTGAELLLNKPEDPPDVLDKHKCLEALANLRRAKWFQARCTMLRSCMIMLRIMKDLCQRDPTWAPLSTWALELLVEKVLISANEPLTPAEAFRHIFEAVSTAFLLPNGPGLLDPCEKDATDALSGLSYQQREDITASAQSFVRLIAFNQIYKVLGMERLSADAFNVATSTQQQRKRTLDGSIGIDEVNIPIKKEKIEPETDFST